MISSLSSQTFSTTTDSLALVPIRALKNALIMKNEKDHLSNQLKNTRDSITNLSETVLLLDSTVTVRDSIIDSYIFKENKHKDIIENKDKIISEKNTEINILKIKNMFSQIGTGMIFVITIIALL